MRRILLAALAVLASALPALADPLVPERRLIVTRDTDFFGGDLQPLFDTTLAACQAQCLNDPACKAFTFNRRSNACFPKTGVSDRQPYEGALSAIVVEGDAAISARAETRAGDLGFLSDSDFRNALSEAAALAVRHGSGEWAPEQLIQSAREAEAAGNTDNASFWTGAALAQTDDAALWADYARLSRARAAATENGNERRNLTSRAQYAAVNAYLRAGDEALRGTALTELARALEDNGRGRDMLHALRLAEGIAPTAEISALLDEAIGKYGFRITEHTVEANSALPRVCAEFSEPLVPAGVDYAPFVRVPDTRLAVQASGSRICVEGVQHGGRYTVTFRQGLPAASGEALIKDVSLTLYVGDREPRASFPGRAYVLPRTADAGIPIDTVNLSTVDLTLYRVDDRTLMRSIQTQYFGQQLSVYDRSRFDGDYAETVWTGVGEVENRLNADVTTRLPVGEILGELPAGVYALTAAVPGADPYDNPAATQWFVLSDIGLTTLKGADGLTVFARRLTDAEPMAGLSVSLLAQSNRELATATTDAQGVARFDAALLRGEGGSAPALVLAEEGETDLAFLSLTDPAFDLSDRGVEGRAPAGPMDLFLATDRGAYRAGEVIRATALLRDGQVRAIDGVPVTAVLTRPDGVEYSRHLSNTALAGGHVFTLPLAPSVPRGTWRLEMFADPDAPALASQTLLVEDFLPERIDFDLTLPEGLLRREDAPQLEIAARYLFGAPGADLPVEGEVRIRTQTTLDAFPGYRFGRYDDETGFATLGLPGDIRTDAQGNASLTLPLDEGDGTGRPSLATVTVRVAEGSGRPVERRITRPVASASPMIGIRPLASGDVIPEGSTAAFDLRAIGPDLQPMPMEVSWTLNRVQTRYQWYQLYGNWEWEPITTRTAVASGRATLGADPVQVTGPVDWGRYELVVERTDGAYVASSVDFYAGWYAPADVTTTPDTLELSLDAQAYRPGDTATLRIVPRYAGKALVTVLSNRVIHMEAVEVTEGENLIPLTVTDDWGAGAYVTASVIRPMDVAAGQNPARAMGLAHAAIDPGARQLAVTLEAPQQSAPRGPLTADVVLANVPDGETAYVTVAAVDVGILNLTGFPSPDPSQHYFGQRRLGIEIRDVYGRLIDGMNGAMGRVRSGGDAGAEMRMESPPPTEELVAYFSGPVSVQNGRATVAFDLPEFNGTVRLMAMAWTPTAVGQAEADVLVRDPVVVTASLPRFLAPGDATRMLLEIVHADGPSGEMPLSVAASGLTLGAAPASVTLSDQGKAVVSVPLSASDVGDHSITVALTTPDGKLLEKTLALGVRANDPATAQTRRFTLAPGATFTLDDEVFAGFRADTSEALISAGPLAKFDAPGLIAQLSRYPYGCTEQVTSQAMPLLYLSSVAQDMGLGNADRIDAYIDAAVTRVLTRQSTNGAFGLWFADSGDFWLDAYVTDFLTRAQAAGHTVPALALQNALDNLRNRIAYAPDFDSGGEDIAYALLVLARQGAAAMGDLRYYADQKGDAFATPMAQAQLGAALAAYGDQTRADLMFAKAARRIAGQLGDDEGSVFRADYGTPLRDAAGLLQLAVEAGSAAVNTDVLAARLAAPGRPLSTQEQSWALLAAHAMTRDPGVSGLTVDGTPVSGAFVRRIEGAGLAPMAIANTSTVPTDVTLTTLGVPSVPEPAGGYGYAIERAFFTMEGAPLETPLRVGDRFVTVLTVRPSETTGARLMVNDPLPAGIEIDNPSLIRSGDVRGLGWLEQVSTQTTEFRADRFLAAVDWRGDKAFQLAYVARAVSPGTFHAPAALVEDMYRPQYRAVTATGTVTVSE